MPTNQSLQTFITLNVDLFHVFNSLNEKKRKIQKHHEHDHDDEATYLYG